MSFGEMEQQLDDQFMVILKLQYRVDFLDTLMSTARGFDVDSAAAADRRIEEAILAAKGEDE